MSRRPTDKSIWVHGKEYEILHKRKYELMVKNISDVIAHLIMSDNRVIGMRQLLNEYEEQLEAANTKIKMLSERLELKYKEEEENTIHNQNNLMEDLR